MPTETPTDHQLLARHLRDRDEDAFATLVQRHLPLVYSAALRQLHGDSHTAEDLSQSVFTELARQAPKLARHPTLAGWLYTTTRNLAAHHRRSDQRRARREQDAATMLDPTPSQPEPDWHDLRHLLDDAMHQLPEQDRLALLLRFFQDQNLRQIGSVLALNENAARMRIDRALEKLRAALARRGVHSTLPALASLLVIHAASSTPAALAHTIAATATAAAAASAPTTLPILKLLPATMKIPALYTATLVLAAIPLLTQETQRTHLRTGLANLESIAATLPALRQAATTEDNNRRNHTELAQLQADAQELLQLRQEIQQLTQAAQTPNLASAQSQLAAAQTAHRQATAQKQWIELRTQTIDTMKHLGLAARIYATDNQDRLPTRFDDLKNELDGALADKLPIDRFEFFPHARRISEREPELFLFREKEPRARPDGQWERTYTLADGSVQTPVLPTPDFSQWERDSRGIALAELPDFLRADPANQTAQPK